MFWWPPLGVSSREWVSTPEYSPPGRSHVWGSECLPLWILSPQQVPCSEGEYTHPKFSHPSGPMSSGVSTHPPLSTHPPGTHPLSTHPLGIPQKRHGTKDTHPSPTCGQTDTCENNTFPQLHWRAVIRRQRSKKNTKADVTCEGTLITTSVYY